MVQISDKEHELIKQLRGKVSNVWKDEYLLSDGNLYNWLHYKNFKLDKAEKSIHKNIKWRADNKIDGILHEKFDDYYESFEFHTDGVDKEGRIVMTSYVMQKDPKEMLDHYIADKDKGDRYAFYRSEFAFDLVRKAHAKSNGKVNSMIGIVDCTGLKLKPFMSKLTELVPRAGSIARQLERNYPGIAEKSYILHAPNKVNTLFTLMKPFLKAETIKKIKIFGKKDQKWREVILSVVDADQIRERYGGTKPDA